MLDARLRDACAPRHLRRLAGERSYERGEEYAAAGRVSGVVVSETALTATATGGERYQEAIDLLAELHALLAADCREAEHAVLVSEIRNVHRRKRNLMKLLDAQEWACR
jgi:uncharacterized Zn finger protein